MKIKKIFSSKKAAFFLILISICFSSCAQKLETKKITIINSFNEEITVKAEIAKTAEERNKGYMFRKHIGDGNGMLFVFEKEQILSFWMKNTPHPLSIAYIDSQGKIRDIFDMTPFSLASVVSSTSVKYALEVPQGYFQKNRIKKGDRIILQKF